MAPLEVGAAIDRIERGDYDAVYFRFLTTDLDPGAEPGLWLSSGSAHVWNPAQAKPATEWERQIDELMHRQVAALDQPTRKALFDQVQRIFAEQLPMIQFAAPRIYVATSDARRERDAGAAAAGDILWNPDRLSVRDARAGHAEDAR